MKDEVFGDIKYQDGAWVREETIEVYGQIETLRLR